MKRPIRPDEHRLWSMVAATIHPLPGRKPAISPTPTMGEPPTAAPSPPPAKSQPAPRWDGAAFQVGEAAGRPGLARLRAAAEDRDKDIEPRRKHRIAKEREPIGGRIDLHGMTQDRARAALEAFLRRSHDEGARAVLVITGKGVQGDGVLRRRTPEWLAAPGLRDVVAGISEAHRRHGGEGALYVALKRKARG
ncbi:Smr/MutS family protein [Phenylobacterium sp.]|uniref:Smr/MutS family protein n=1 Tax=Phenylobacterium sp. TaxID=1871053 RepID=UPI00286BE652|nr:Smr/MutS family protein [Phenylobacterium sp.]